MQERENREVPAGTEHEGISFPNRMSSYPVLSDPSLARLLGSSAATGRVSRPRGSVLFTEGQKVLGVYVLWSGLVKLSIGSDNGKLLILGLVDRGAVFDLPGAILGLPHVATAAVVRDARISFFPRDDLLRHLHGTESAAYAAAEMVSAIYYSALAELRAIQSHSAEQKIARFLLGLPAASDGSGGQLGVTLELSHEEIGQMIGVCRETVTRIISRFRKKRILELKTTALVIHNRFALAKLADFPASEESARARA